jgi:hypothetical protein
MTETYRRVIPGLLPGEKYVVRARELNENNTTSDWTDSLLLTIPSTAVEGDPSVVSNVSVVPGIKILYISFDANTENDLAGYNLYVGNSSGFTADETTLVKEVSPLTLTAVADYYDTDGATLSGPLPMVSSTIDNPVTYYVQVRARNLFGGLSAPVEVSGSPGQVDNNTIESLVIDKLLAGNLDVAMTLNAGQIQTADSGQRFVIDGNSFSAYKSTGATPWYELSSTTEDAIYRATDGSILKLSADGGVIGAVTEDYGATPDFRLDATGLYLSGGTFEAGSIDIPNTTAPSSWHVDADGNMWWGSAASYATSNIHISASGAARLASLKLFGSSTNIQVENDAFLNVNTATSGGGAISLGAAGDGPVYLGKFSNFGANLSNMTGVAYPSTTAPGGGVGTLAGLSFRIVDTGLTAGSSSYETYLTSGKTPAPSAPDEGDEARIQLQSSSNGANGAGNSRIRYYATEDHYFQVGNLKGPSGTTLDPTFTFTGDDNTGMYRYAENSIGFAMGGGAGVRFTSVDDIYQNGDYHGFNSLTSSADSIQHTGTDINFRTNGEVAFRIQRETTDRFTCNVDQTISNTADAQYLGYRFSDDPDTGLYRHATDILGLAAGGNPSGAFTSTGVAINNSTATGTGTNCDLVSASVGSVTMWAIRRDTSLRKYKSDILDFELSDEQFMAIQPRTFVWDGQYVGPDGRFGTTNGDDVDDVIPEGSQLLRRGGFIFEELAEIDLHLIGHESVDWKAMTSALVAQVQKLQRRVDILESGKLNS